MTVYLDFATVAAINAEHGGPGAGVRDKEGIEGAIGRPYSTGFGSDLYPDLWTKAAAYLHGLCSTQYFHDGNKRTAWLVATTFLRENGRLLPKVSDVEAEAFVLSVARELFSNEDEPDRTIEMAAEWFQTKWNEQRVGPAIDPRLEYCYLAMMVQESDPGTINTIGSGMYTITHDASYPVDLPFFVVGRLHWDGIDPLIPHELGLHVVPDEGYKRITNNSETFTFSAIPPSGHAHHHKGIMPTLFWRDMMPKFRQDSSAVVRVSLDGELIAELPFRVLRT